MSNRKTRRKAAKVGTPVWAARRLRRMGATAEFVATYLLIESHAEAGIPYEVRR